MPWPTYVSRGKTILRTNCSTQKQRGECELLQQHYRLWDEFGGIVAFNEALIESGIDTSSLVKPGMPLKEWCKNPTVLPLNALGVEMAERVNRMARGNKASIAGEGSSLGQLFFKAFRFALDNKIPFSGDGVLSAAYQAVRENTTRLSLSEAFQVVLDNTTRFSEACQAVLENTTRFSEACQGVTGDKTWIGLMALVIAVGAMLGKGRWRGGRNVLNSGSTEDDDDDDGGHVDGPETDAGDDGDNNGDKDSEQFSGAMCRVTLDEPSGAHRTAKALPRWEWGHFRPCGQNVRVTPDGQVRYRVCLPLMNEGGWFRADQIEFPDGETFNGHDLRKRVKVQV